MEDVLTELPPPSRFFEEDLNIFTSPSPPLQTPLLSLSEPYTNETLHPSLLIFALSAPALNIFHHASKTLVGTLILPEIPHSGNTTTPSLKDKSCNIYALNNTEKMVLIVSVQYHIPPERCHAVSKQLLGERIVPERVLILDSIQIQKFRGKLSRDDTVAYKLVTSSERKGSEDGSRGLLGDLEYYPSGSLVDGLGAALLARCQIRNIKGTLCVSWPEYGKSVMQLVKSLLMKNVLPDFDFGSVSCVNDGWKPSWIKDPFLTELYT